MSYKSWKFRRWDTPLDDSRDVALKELRTCERDVSLVLDAGGALFEFVFREVVAYRNIVERYRLELWEVLGAQLPERGWALEIEAPNWASELKESEPLVQPFHPALRHFMICTDEDVLEILTERTPEIRRVSQHGA
jgi:hypothetical protein